MGSAAELTPSLACPDWVERLRDGRSLLPDDLPIDRAEADRAVAIFNKLCLPDVEGQPLLADVAGEWQRDIVRVLFGSIDAETKERWLREIFALVPKKNSKTTGGAAIMMTALLMNRRPRAEFVLVGPTQEVADTAFQQAAGMIEADDFLRTRFQVSEHIKTITDRVTKAKLKIKTFDMKVATGSKPAGILLDELHLMSAMGDASRVIGQLRGGMIANPEAFMVIITTQSDKPPAGAFKVELEYARGVRDGRIVEEVATLPLLYEFPQAMQAGTGEQKRDKSEPWRDPANWPMVLPNLGRSITIERLKGEYWTASEKGVEEMQRWASQHLNIELGTGLNLGRWRGADFWDGAAVPAIRSFEAFLTRCEVVVAAVDGGGMDDLTGFAAAGRCKKTKVWLYWNHAYAHRKVINLRKDISSSLKDFEADGDLTFWGDAEEQMSVQALLDNEDGRTARNVGDEDVRAIVALCIRIRELGLFPQYFGIGVDPAAIGAIADALEAEGFLLTARNSEDGTVHKGNVHSVSQSAVNMNSAINTLARKIEGGTAGHGGTRLMSWCVANAKEEVRGGSVIITKQTSGRAKIDPLIASFMATKLLETNPEAAGGSIYESRGLLVL